MHRFFAELTFVEVFFLFYFILIFGSYLIQSIGSTYLVYSYAQRNKYFDSHEMLKGDYLPKIALVAPAYNEEAVVIDAVNSLLGIQYFNFELIVVNDGSKDSTMKLLIDNFDLYENEVIAYSDIPTKPVKALYRSKNLAYKNLVVIDKENGRKADAANVGINYSEADYYSVIDIDCILEQDVLLKLVEPIIHEKKKRVVAVGGVIGATNGSEINHGALVNLIQPQNYVDRIQIIEYLRSFILSRPFWAKINGLLLISGALGLFEKEVIHGVKGFSHDSIGEDMDLVMKMHQYCYENNIDYSIEYIPFPLCWTEVPPDFKMLGSQRNRWMRGTIQCMQKFKKFAFNPKYGIIGMLSYPYWFFAELLAPLIEFLGFFLIIYFLYIGLMNIKFAILLFSFSYLLGTLISFLALVVYASNFKKYLNQKYSLRFLGTILLEPIIYHPRVLFWSLRGYYDYFIKKTNVWGEMKRQGFQKPKSQST